MVCCTRATVIFVAGGCFCLGRFFWARLRVSQRRLLWGMSKTLLFGGSSSQPARGRRGGAPPWGAGARAPPRPPPAPPLGPAPPALGSGKRRCGHPHERIPHPLALAKEISPKDRRLGVGPRRRERRRRDHRRRRE